MKVAFLTVKEKEKSSMSAQMQEVLLRAVQGVERPESRKKEESVRG